MLRGKLKGAQEADSQLPTSENRGAKKSVRIKESEIEATLRLSQPVTSTGERIANSSTTTGGGINEGAPKTSVKVKSQSESRKSVFNLSEKDTSVAKEERERKEGETEKLFAMVGKSLPRHAFEKILEKEVEAEMKAELKATEAGFKMLQCLGGSETGGDQKKLINELGGRAKCEIPEYTTCR